MHININWYSLCLLISISSLIFRFITHAEHMLSNGAYRRLLLFFLLLLYHLLLIEIIQVAILPFLHRIKLPLYYVRRRTHVKYIIQTFFFWRIQHEIKYVRRRFFFLLVSGWSEIQCHRLYEFNKNKIRLLWSNLLKYTMLVKKKNITNVFCWELLFICLWKLE